MRGQRRFSSDPRPLRDVDEVQEYAESFAGRDLKPLVTLIDSEGVDYLRLILTRVAPEDEATTSFPPSTAPKASNGTASSSPATSNSRMTKASSRWPQRKCDCSMSP
jgi:hypothetical protein